jgi:hypothetical protein
VQESPLLHEALHLEIPDRGFIEVAREEKGTELPPVFRSRLIDQLNRQSKHGGDGLELRRRYVGAPLNIASGHRPSARKLTDGIEPIREPPAERGTGTFC